jgi:hypothetical protein
MPGVAITGWNKGCNTVTAIKAIREKAHISLAEALAIVNRVLNNEHVVVPVSSPDVAQALADALGTMGLIATNLDE